MTYILAQFWLWLLPALAFGLVVGWLTYKGRNPAILRDMWPWALVFLIGAVVVLMRMLPDRSGLWAELGLMLALGYFVGCCISYWLRAALGGADKHAGAMAGASGATTIATREVAVEPAKEAAAKAEEAASEEAILGLSAPRSGNKDDLTKIYGIDAETESKMNALGIFHFDQIAAMRPGQSRWLFARLGHDGRFPSWWWRWKYDAGLLAEGKTPDPAGTSLEAMTALGLAGASASNDGAGGKPSEASSQGVASGSVHVLKAVADAELSATSDKKPPASAKKPAASAAGNLDPAAYEGNKPVGLAHARDGKIDDLKRISGIGKQNEGRLHALGIWHFDQIAAWSDDEIKWVGSYLAFSGRIQREDWKGQAATLAKGGATEFSARADKGDVKTSRDDADDDGKSNIASLDKPVTKPPKG